MRNSFDTQLLQLRKELTYLGALCETAIANAAKALQNNDIEIAKIAVYADDEIDRKEHEIESFCLKMLLQQQPVAKDLRQISAALKMITDMERIGDQAADIAEIVITSNLKSELGITHIKEMALETINMVNLSLDAFVNEDMNLAYEVIKMDDKVDGLFVTIKKELTEIVTNGTDGEVALDLLMIAKYFERIGDHATNIAEWVVFSITGEHKSMQ